MLVTICWRVQFGAHPFNAEGLSRSCSASNVLKHGRAFFFPSGWCQSFTAVSVLMTLSSRSISFLIGNRNRGFHKGVKNLWKWDVMWDTLGGAGSEWEPFSGGSCWSSAFLLQQLRQDNMKINIRNQNICRMTQKEAEISFQNKWLSSDSCPPCAHYFWILCSRFNSTHLGVNIIYGCRLSSLQLTGPINLPYDNLKIQEKE